MKQFLKFMPLAAALLFATSCDKDENNDTKSDNGLVTVPFTVKVETGSKVSKIAYAENQGAFTPSFETSEVGTLTMSLTSEELGNNTLTLQDLNGTFSGDLEMTAEQKEQFDEGKIKFVGTIGNTAATFATNTTSLKDLIEECAHQYKTAEFASNETSGIGLTDQNSYLAITWTNKGGATVKFTINGSEKSITLNEDGQGWIAVPGGAMVACADLEITSATTTVGKIHNISRTFSAVPAGYVDLGVTIGTQHIYFEKSDSYTHVAWQGQDHSDWPTVAEWTALKDQCYWKLADDNGGYYVFKVHDNDDAGKVTNQDQESTHTPSVAYSTATEPYIFLPVIVAGSGYYWSSGSIDDEDAFCLYFRSYSVDPDHGYPKDRGVPGVVTVRRSN